MDQKTVTTLDRLLELQRFYIEGTHFQEETWRIKWEMLLNILIDDQKEKK